MPANPLDNWIRFQASLPEPAAPPRGLELPSEPAQDVATFPAHGSPPAGFANLTERLIDKGLMNAQATPRVAVRDGSPTMRDINDALTILPARVPLAINLITGLSAQCAHAALTLIKHGVIPQEQVATELDSHFVYANRQPTDKLAHLLAAVGNEYASEDAESLLSEERGVSLAERFHMLAAAGFSLTAEDSQGLTPAHHAAANDNIDALDALAENGVKIHAPNQAGLTPLLSAAANRSTRALNHLLGRNTQRAPASDPNASLVRWIEPLPDAVNHTDNRGRTAVQLAMSSTAGEHHGQAYRDTLQALARGGAVGVGSRGNFEHMARHGTADNIRGLIEAGKLQSQALTSDLTWAAVKHGNAQTAQALLASLPIREQRRLLIQATREDRQTLQHFIQLTGVDVNLSEEGISVVDDLIDEQEQRNLGGPGSADPFHAAMHLVEAGAHVSEATRNQMIDAALSIDAYRMNGSGAYHAL